MDIAKFSQYAKHKDGTYVAFEMSKDSRELLDHFISQVLGPIERVDPKSYHITVIYSRTPVPDADNLPRDMSAEANATGYEVFQTKDGGKCLVLRVESGEARALNKKLGRMGATSDFPDYKPHVTLCYNMSEDIDVADLPVPKFSLTFDKLTVDPLDPEFVPANK